MEWMAVWLATGRSLGLALGYADMGHGSWDREFWNNPILLSYHSASQSAKQAS